MPKSRALATTARVRDGVFREKTFKETWFEDKGAYPVMSIIVLGSLACTIFGGYYMVTSPDVKLVPGGSRSRMFRVDIANDYVKEDIDVSKQ